MIHGSSSGPAEEDHREKSTRSGRRESSRSQASRMRTLYPFNTFATSLHPPRFQLATRFIDYILAATITVFPKFSKKMSERKSIGALFNSDLFLSRIKSNRVFETVIFRAQRPGQKGFRRLFSIYSLFVPRGGGGEHLPFPVRLFLPRQAASQNFIFPE